MELNGFFRPSFLSCGAHNCDNHGKGWTSFVYDSVRCSLVYFAKTLSCPCGQPTSVHTHLPVIELGFLPSSKYFRFFYEMIRKPVICHHLMRCSSSRKIQRDWLVAQTQKQKVYQQSLDWKWSSGWLESWEDCGWRLRFRQPVRKPSLESSDSFSQLKIQKTLVSDSIGVE